MDTSGCDGFFGGEGEGVSALLTCHKGEGLAGVATGADGRDREFRLFDVADERILDFGAGDG